MAMALPVSTAKSSSSPRVKGNSDGIREAKELRLHQLIDLTFEKIETIRGYLVKEAAILGMDVQDAEISAVLQRQNHLMNRAINCFNDNSNSFQNSPYRGIHTREDRRAMSGRKHTVSFKMDTDDELAASINMSTTGMSREEKPYRYDGGARNDEKPRMVRGGETVSSKSIDSEHREEYKVDPSWFGSLDRNYGKKKKEAMDRRRRHTKTIGSMAGLDFIKKSHELQPDEQYEIGLPRVASRSSSKLSTNITASLSYPILPPSWTRTTDAIDSSQSQNIMLRSPMLVNPMPNAVSHHHHRQHSGITEFDYSNLSVGTGKNAAMAKELVKARLGTGSSHIPHTSSPFSASRTSTSSKSWFETNLDDGDIISQLSPVLPGSVTGVGSSSGSGVSLTDGLDGSISRLHLSGPISDAHEINSNESNESWSGFANESTKPFEMSDYYKYSTKYRTPRHGLRNGDVEEAAKITPSPALHTLLQTPLPEERKNYLMDFFSGRGAEDATYRHPQPDNRKGDVNEAINATPSPSLATLTLLKTPLSEERKNYLMDYFNQLPPGTAAAYRHLDPNNGKDNSSFSSPMTTPVGEERKRYLIDYYTRKAVEDEAYSHPKPGSRKGDTSGFTNVIPVSALSPANPIQSSSQSQTPLTEEQYNLMEYFGRKAVEHDAALKLRRDDKDAVRPKLPKLPPKYKRNGSKPPYKTNDANSDPVEELLAWMPDTPTFV